ncbi:MAG: hypothetical protein WKF76_08010 [Nocardioidaceae bacterium]
MTSQAKFYRIDTALSAPQILPKDWELRIHGMVDREVTLTYQRSARPGARAGMGHTVLRLQPGRRRPDLQRIVVRRTDR